MRKPFIFSILAIFGLIGCSWLERDEPQTIEVSESEPVTLTEEIRVSEHTEEQKPAAAGVERVQIQHILIGFKGSLPGTDLDRTKDEAAKLAQELMKKAESEEFLELVRAHSDDQVPGIYNVVNHGVTPDGGEFMRGDMVKGFSDMAFKLKPGEIGLVMFDEQTSPYGWHIVKRLK